MLINTSDIQGGAARAAYRIHKGLQTQGVDSTMLVQSKSSDDPSVLGPKGKVDKGLANLRPHLEYLPLQRYRGRQATPWSAAWLPNSAARQINHLNPDIVHIHWVCGGFLSVASLSRINRPLVWTLHDCWAFTGGCHYPDGCERFQDRCGACPQLGSQGEHDLSRWVWDRKAKHWRNLNLTIVTPSRWLAGLARASSLFKDLRVEVIHNCLDLEIYKPVERQMARQLLNIPNDLIVVTALGVSDPRKGFQYLLAALELLVKDNRRQETMLLVIGSSQGPGIVNGLLETRYLGRLHDDLSLRLAYAAADVFVFPSQQDNLPNMVLEALACGTPVVAFDVGGLPDLIDHNINGYLARPFDIQDLAHGIAWVLANPERHQTLRQAARAKAEKTFSIQRVAGLYASLFEDILKDDSNR